MLERPKKGVAGVYRWLNLVNGKIYIGSSVNCSKRKSQHVDALNKGTHKSKHLLSAWKKYGSEVFWFSVVEITEATKEAVLAAEQKWLDAVKPFGENGYNKSPQAESPLGVIRSADYKRKMSERMRGRKLSDEIREKMSLSRMGIKKTRLHAVNISLGKSIFVGDRLSELLDLRSSGKSIKDLSLHFKCHPCTVSNALNGRSVALSNIRDPMPKSERPDGRFKQRLSEVDAMSLKQMLFEGVQRKNVARHFGVTIGTVNDIAWGRYYKDVVLDFTQPGFY